MSSLPVASPSPGRIIVVAGDLSCIWTLADLTRDRHVTDARRRTRASSQPGGASLLADLVQAALHSGSSIPLSSNRVVHPAPTHDACDPVNRLMSHQFTLCDQLDAAPAGKSKPARVWRVREQLGIDVAMHDSPERAEIHRVADDSPLADVVVLDDEAMGFREHPAWWPAAIKAASHQPWVVLCLDAPFEQSPLWNRLMENHADRLVVVTTAEWLRQSGAGISQGRSWEATAESLIHELSHNPLVSAMSDAMHVVVSFGTDGALVLSRVGDASDGKRQATLAFDANGVEGVWLRGRPGLVPGLNQCLAAMLIPAVLTGVKHGLLVERAITGIGAMREAHEGGLIATVTSSGDQMLAWPIAACKNAKAPGEIGVASVPLAEDTHSTEPSRPWRILESRYEASGFPGLDELAMQILLQGVEKSTRGLPIGRFGDLITIDRFEIESLNNLGEVIAKYLAGRSKKPLSLAVFGPPGSGKSFAVLEIAGAILPSKDAPPTFNLTQLSDERGLVGRFHQVRDRVLLGTVPLVFWDEFDTTLHGQKLGWLSKFLAPMADGTFDDDQLTHPIGRAIFVFAGGTSSSMAAFNRGPDHDEFKHAKGPDFVRRLSATLDIMGPNRLGESSIGADPYFVVRRAILVRSLLRKAAPWLFHGPDESAQLNIEPGLARAFLLGPRYTHGAGSIRAIIDSSVLVGHSSFGRACLPHESVLQDHVELREFRAIMEQFTPDADQLESLAAAAHDRYCDGKKRDGWVYGAVRDDSKKIHNLLVPFDQLPETYKVANRTTVRNIPRKLAAAGLSMRPATKPITLYVLSDAEIEKMAVLEHELWMADRIAAGFTLGPESPSSKTNPYLVPWERLPESIKVIDRDLVKGIPALLARAGFAVVRASR